MSVVVMEGNDLGVQRDHAFL